ncbi:hypothetical protein GCM10010245_90530 [Streptomyces spectabilis]|nr:hypothetical protein GCM10010245_90530 [Streptomyces spectabilis]
MRCGSDHGRRPHGRTGAHHEAAELLALAEHVGRGPGLHRLTDLAVEYQLAQPGRRPGAAWPVVPRFAGGPVSSERTSVGLDVHARSVVACAIDTVTGELIRCRLTPQHADVRG